MRSVVIAAFVLLASAQAITAAATETVTLTVVRTYDERLNAYRARFSGTVSSGAEGEDVTVMQQTCGNSFATAIAGTQTRVGGVWDVEPASPYLIAPSATYRARWKDVQSEPVTARAKIPVFFFPSVRGLWRASVSLGSVQQEMRGRIIVLQRLVKGKWKTIERKRLALGPAGGSGYSYVAQFRIRKRGWSVRVLIPAASAAPCFTSNATKKQKT